MRCRLMSAVALALTLGIAAARPAAAQSGDAATESAKAELKKFLAEKKVEGENALELFSVLVEGKVKPAEALAIAKAGVEADAKWDFADLIEKIEEKSSGGTKGDELAKVAREEIAAHKPK